MNSANSRGFTLIELVVVIALLGILAAFAIPRFASLENQARIATVQGLEGSLRSSAAMARGLALATGSTTSVTMEGQNINLAFGYPDAASVENTLSDLSGFNPNNAGGTTTFEKTGAPTPSTCSVEYTEPAAADTAPTIVPDFSGC